MKLIYIASATTESGDSIQENAYTTADRALEQAKLMCEDIKRNAGFEATPDVIPMDLYEEGDTISTTVSSLG